MYALRISLHTKAQDARGVDWGRNAYYLLAIASFQSKNDTDFEIFLEQEKRPKLFIASEDFLDTKMMFLLIRKRSDQFEKEME